MRLGSAKREDTRGPDGIPSPVEQVWHLADLEREGFRERIGRVALCDIPGFMFQHDFAHRTEIEAWKASVS